MLLVGFRSGDKAPVPATKASVTYLALTTGSITED